MTGLFSTGIECMECTLNTVVLILGGSGSKDSLRRLGLPVNKEKDSDEMEWFKVIVSTTID